MDTSRPPEGWDAPLPHIPHIPPSTDSLFLFDSEALFAHNIEQINQMHVAAGSMVKGLIMELQRGDRDTFIRLSDPDPGGHCVGYRFVQGDPSLVGRIARALGFALVTDDRLEVRRG